MWQRQDGRHVLGPAACALDHIEWLDVGGKTAAWEAIWWGFAPPAESDRSGAGAPPDHVSLYPDAGAFVARQSGNYLLVTNARVGTKGFGNHKHNDQLGFELHIAGTPIVVDPGNWVYTSDFAGRNRFRSTAAHSTLAIDGIEQNEFDPKWLFRMFEKANAEHLEHGVDDNIAFYSGRHVGYQRLQAPVTHTRRFSFSLADGALDIEDRLDGSGEHDLLWTFQLAPGAEVSVEKASAVCVWPERGMNIAFDWPAGLCGRIEESFVSPSYGVRASAPALKISGHREISAGSTFAFRVRRVQEQ
jgi:hypothetical protein